MTEFGRSGTPAAHGEVRNRCAGGNVASHRLRGRTRPTALNLENRMLKDLGESDPLVAILYSAYCAGSRIPEVEPSRSELARAARRRWNSFKHRHPTPAPDTLSARIEDLARGLLARCVAVAGARPTIEISECRDLARRLAGVLGERHRGDVAIAGTHGPGRSCRKFVNAGHEPTGPVADPR
jgi:hypothetical protein